MLDAMQSDSCIIANEFQSGIYHAAGFVRRYWETIQKINLEKKQKIEETFFSRYNFMRYNAINNGVWYIRRIPYTTGQDQFSNRKSPSTVLWCFRIQYDLKLLLLTFLLHLLLIQYRIHRTQSTHIIIIYLFIIRRKLETLHCIGVFVRVFSSSFTLIFHLPSSSSSSGCARANFHFRMISIQVVHAAHICHSHECEKKTNRSGTYEHFVWKL